METIVIAKPIELTMVNAVPLIDASAFCATNVESIGESAITDTPHKIKNTKNAHEGTALPTTTGATRQQQPDSIRASSAVFEGPILLERYPAKMQEGPPIPMVTKAQNGTLISGIVREK